MAVKRTWLAVGALAVSFAIAGPSWSGEPSSGDSAAARTLFDQARALVAAGKHAEACPKLEESQRLAPGTGTLFNLADCYEKIGKTASAWTLFLDVASQTKAAGQAEKEKVARERAAALEPKLARLTVMVPAAVEVADLEVARDGTPLRKPVWSTALPVDPGSHVVEVKAPGRKTWSTKIEVGKMANETVTVPPLEKLPSAVSTAASGPVASTEEPVPDTGKPGSSQRLIGLVVGGVGVVGIGVSLIVGLGAKSKLSDAEAYCNGNVCSDRRGVDLRSDARSQANVATIIGGIGAAALVGGVVLYLTAPSAQATKTSSRPETTVVLGPGTLSLRGVW